MQQNSGDTRPRRRALVTIALLAIGALLALWLALSTRRLYGRAYLTAALSTGMTRGDVVRRLGQPEQVIRQAEGYAREPFGRFEKPQREIDDCVLAYAVAGQILYVFLDDEDRVTCVYWARPSVR